MVFCKNAAQASSSRGRILAYRASLASHIRTVPAASRVRGVLTCLQSLVSTGALTAQAEAEGGRPTGAVPVVGALRRHLQGGRRPSLSRQAPSPAVSSWIRIILRVLITEVAAPVPSVAGSYRDMPSRTAIATAHVTPNSPPREKLLYDPQASKSFVSTSSTVQGSGKRWTSARRQIRLQHAPIMKRSKA